MPEIRDDDLSGLVEALGELPDCMRGYSLSMRSVYLEEPVGQNEVTVKFRELRDGIRDDGVVYLSGLLPVTEKFILYLQMAFENYTVLTFEEWKQYLSLIIQETKDYQEVASALIKMHLDFLVPLKEREDKATVVVKELKELSAEYEKRADELEAQAAEKRKWAIGLAFIPFVNYVATPVLVNSMSGDLEAAKAKVEEAKNAEASAFTIETTLIPALMQLIKGLELVAGFLMILYQELINFEEQGEGAEGDMELHYNKMKAKAEDIIQGCRAFYAVLPEIESDLRTISTEGLDVNYVNEWLEKQKETIRQEVSSESIAKALILAIGLEMKKNNVGRFRQ